MPEEQKTYFAPWYERFPERFNEEDERLHAAGFRRDQESLLKHQALVYRGSLEEFPERSLIVSFPVSYPSTPPIIQDDKKCEPLRRHQNLFHRTYCLFGPKAGAWDAHSNVSHALAQVADLCRKYGPVSTPEIPSEGPEFPEPNSLDYSEEPDGYLLVPPRITEVMPESSKIVQGRFSVSTIRPNPQENIKQRSVITELRFSSGDQHAISGKFYSQAFGSNCQQGTVYFLPDCNGPIHSLSDLTNILREHQINLVTNREWVAVILPEESANSVNLRYAWKAFHRTGRSYRPVITSTCTAAENEARVPGYDFLLSKKVALIGCGSLGSKIAVALAASGVSKFAILDPETYEAHNAVRHECGVQSHGLPKIHALVQRLMQMNPNLEGKVAGATGIGQGISHLEETEKIKMLVDADIVVDATGNAQISRYINELTLELKIPAVYVSGTNGGWSGEVVRSIPGVTACWNCYDAEYGGEERAPPSEPLSSEVEYLYAPGCDQPTFTGTTYDMGFIANLASGFVVDTLRHSSFGTSDYSGDYLIWHNRDEEGRPIHQLEIKQTHVRKFTDETSCHLCG